MNGSSFNRFTTMSTHKRPVGRVPKPTTAPPASSWWAKALTRSEFMAVHAEQVPRMTAVTSTYRYAHDEGM
jgi:hypothetical protein